MRVLKFGGSSVANAENIKKVNEIIKKSAQQDKTIIVVSALSGITDLLLQSGTKAADGDEVYKENIRTIEHRHFEAIKQLIPVAHQSQLLSLVKKSINEIEDICNGIFLLSEITPRTKDRLASYGEWLSSQIIAASLNYSDFEITWKDAKELIVTNSNFTHAEVDFEKTNKKIRTYFKETDAHTFIIPGFIAVNKKGITTTLGRGGSDYTAAIITTALNADILEIWTDVSGMMTADPRLTSNAKVIHHISYREAMELSHFGAKVIYPPTIQPVMNKGIPVWIKNTFAPDDYGTKVTTEIDKSAEDEENIVRGISSINNISLLSLEGGGMVGIPGFSRRLFGALSSEQINVILITQSSSEHSICVAIDSNDTVKAKKAVDKVFEDEILLKKVDPLKIENAHSIIALVGENMKNHTGVSGRMFSALGRNGINIRAIAQGSSEKNISTVIATHDVSKAINVLHEEFFETTIKHVNLFITGTGNVGSKLLNQLHQQAATLKKQLNLDIQVAGLSNSRKMIFKNEGIDLSNWKEALDKGSEASISKFVNEAIARNLRNSIFVDVTANKDVAALYEKLLKKSIAVVACNKIAASSEYKNYKYLKELAREYNSKFLFETNVGAALPVIGTLNDLMRSGDKINRIEAVLSGTLNFVFNHYKGEVSFAKVVKQAQEEGY
ncbi:MAG TPA: bifunctional aspartate kinase/homoserine dehydrogenase I, partial [Niabella sp.]|nr:bifunctional aspartate kinase/homoserine dehydrogenase I [Niabella sp.]